MQAFSRLKSAVPLVIMVLTLMAWRVPAASATEVNAQARAALPEATRKSGVLKTALNYHYPPFGYVDAQEKPDGIDIRIVKLIAAKLGLEPQLENVRLASVMPGIANGRYDLALSALRVTEERARAGDYVTYFKSGYGLLVRPGDENFDINNLCGYSIVLTQGSSQISIAERLSEECVKAGKPKIELVFYPASANSYMAVANGRGSAFITPKPVAAYIAKQYSGSLVVAKHSLADEVTIIAMYLGKGNTAFRNAVQLAMESIIEDGSYQKMLAEFGVADGALSIEEVRNPPKF